MAGADVHSRDWIVQPAATRGTRIAAEPAADFPAAFLTRESHVADAFVAQPAPATRAAGGAPGPLDVSYDLAPGEAAVLAIRHPSGALTFHRPVESRTRGVKAGRVHFVVHVRSVEPGSRTRGLVSQAIKAILIKVTKTAGDKATSWLLPKLAASYESSTWRKQGLREGWVRVTKATLASGKLAAGKPPATGRNLLLLHGTFSHTAAAFAPLAANGFFERVEAMYGRRIFGFNHFSISRTPEENARLLVAGLPRGFRGTIDVVTHSRGGLVLRNLVERASIVGPAAKRFTLGRAVLVAAPNDGTPLATPQRWEDTVGWIANLLELFPDNPLTTGAEFVANGIVWIARHASGDLPGLQAMDADGAQIQALQGPPGPPAAAYSALVSNYHPNDRVLQRMLDTGVDQFFGGANDLVVPSAGGWQIDREAGAFIPGERIGCFGAGGNLSSSSVNHVDFFKQPETVEFLVRGLEGRPQSLKLVDPTATLPDHRVFRSGSGAPRLGRGFGGGSVQMLEAAAPPEPPLKITIVNGDLTFENNPLLLGHYRSTRLTGTERVMNSLIGGAMERSLDLGAYPDAAGSSRVFLNTQIDPESPTGLPRPAAVIVVGLGEEGKLRPLDVSMTIRQAVISWAQRLGEQGGQAETFDLAATLVGSGGTGINAGQAAQYIAQGVQEANALLRQTSKSPVWPRVDRLRLIELYLDRASDAWRALKMQAIAAPTRFAIDDVVQTGIGGLPRALDSGYRGADYDFITAETQELSSGETQIAYTLDTRRARAEVRAQGTQGALLRDLIATASNDRNTDEQIGRTLFKLLIPIEMEPYLASSGEMQIQLDAGTAGIPWELLDTDDVKVGDEPRLPWAIRARLLRKLRTTEFRGQVNDASAGASVLVIGEPACPSDYPRLSGARREARAVCERLSAGGLDAGRIEPLIATDEPNVAGPDARTVVNALFARDWRIVHIAGHGAPPDGVAASGGVVLSNGSFLGPREIGTMRAVPELVFVNCCHLAARDAEQALQSEQSRAYDKARFAAGVAEKLIEIGVRCVIAAGWAVDDQAASTFATTFYDSLLRGERFIEAIARARQAAYDEGGNTWAAYQCYGDPDWIFLKDVPDGQRPAQALVDEYAGIASPAALKLALDTIVVRIKFQRAKPAAQLERVAGLEKRFAERWGSTGLIAESFGHAYKEAGDAERAIEWYRRALEANDGTASIKAAEQIANLRVRGAWRRVDKAMKAAKSDQTASAWTSTVEGARTEIAEVTAFLDALVGLQPTLERLSIYGSAMKRLAMIEGAAGRSREAKSALEAMKTRYEAAQAVGVQHKDPDVFYPAMNAMTADLLLNAGQAKWKGFSKKAVDIAKKSLDERCTNDPDFWSVVGQAELSLFQAIARKQLSSGLPKLEAAFEDVYRRVAASWLWSSVADNAQMVLEPYVKASKSASEKKAAKVLVERLKGYATPRP